MTTPSPSYSSAAPLLFSTEEKRLIASMATFIHQHLSLVDDKYYTHTRITTACRAFPSIMRLLCDAFHHRFSPSKEMRDEETLLNAAYDQLMSHTNQEDAKILLYTIPFIRFTLKTTFYCSECPAMGFRLDPNYLKVAPYASHALFPEIPYALFFIHGKHFFAFHIRFRDLSRGGLRTVTPAIGAENDQEETRILLECYQLAWTQQKKNKEIPEGGGKGVIFISSFKQPPSCTSDETVTRLHSIHLAQRDTIQTLMPLINCSIDGKLRHKQVVDYWKKPEWLYLGPDEQLDEEMISWIADYSMQCQYPPGTAFMSSKPIGGINHRQYGVTSHGLHVYLSHVLRTLGIDPHHTPFTVKMTGGPDGDVAGNQLLNLWRDYPQTARLVALTDGTGTIRDPRGLNLATIATLCQQRRGIAHYPPHQLSPGGFLLNKERIQSDAQGNMSCHYWHMTPSGDLVEEDLLWPQALALLAENVHQTPANLFIPAGGRPRTLDLAHLHTFLDKTGKATAQAIIEGANLYLDQDARLALEEKGVLIIKDSSANKGGVICSSYEVLCGLTLDLPEFLAHKDQLVAEILSRIAYYASQEALLLFHLHQKTNQPLTILSDRVSEQINRYRDELLSFLNPISLSDSPNEFWTQCLLEYALPTLSSRFASRLTTRLPINHQKAVIACHIASQYVYKEGFNGESSILPHLFALLSKNSKTQQSK